MFIILFIFKLPILDIINIFRAGHISSTKSILYISDQNIGSV